jgi:hypothetical protein
MYRDMFYYEYKNKKVVKITPKNLHSTYRRIIDREIMVATRFNLFLAYFIASDGYDMNVEILWT